MLQPTHWKFVRCYLERQTVPCCLRRRFAGSVFVLTTQGNLRFTLGACKGWSALSDIFNHALNSCFWNVQLCATAWIVASWKDTAFFLAFVCFAFHKCQRSFANATSIVSRQRPLMDQQFIGINCSRTITVSKWLHHQPTWKGQLWQK